MESEILDLEAFVGAAVARNDRCIRNQGIVDTREWHQVGLEFSQIHVKSTIEPEARRDRADNLGNQAVQVFIARARDIEVASANVINSLIVHQEGAVRVLNGAVGRQNGVVRLHDSCRYTRRRVHCEFELGLLAIFGGEALEKQSTEARAGTTTKRVEDQESLQRVTVVW